MPTPFIKIAFFIFIFFSCLIKIHAQAPLCQWSFVNNPNGDSYGNDVVTDNFGNVYLIGQYASTSISFGGITLTNQGDFDVYILKCNPIGSPLWAVNVGGTEREDATGIKIDLNGNVLVSGTYESPTINLGSTTLTNTSSIPESDIMVLKYDPNGNLVWAKSAGDSLQDRSSGIAVDALGNVLVTGRYSGPTMTFDTATINNTNNGTADIFIVKYDAMGNLIWVNTEGSISGESSNNIATDNNGNAYITGNFSDPSFVIGATTLTNMGGADIYIAKYDTDGNRIWATSAGGNSYENAYGIDTDGNGNIIITGEFSSSSMVIGSSALSNSGSRDIFVAKYDSSGNSLWAKVVGGDGDDWGVDISFSLSGNSVITGFFSSSTLSAGSLNTINSGSTDALLLKYDPNGQEQWLKTPTGNASENGYSTTFDLNENIYMTGSSYSSTINFGNGPISSSAAYSKLFLAKYDGSLLGIQDNSLNENFLLFPNPFAGKATLELSGEITNGSLLILNNLGKIVQQYDQVYGNKIIISKDDLESGMYVYQLFENGAILQQGKFIIK